MFTMLMILATLTITTMVMLENLVSMIMVIIMQTIWTASSTNYLKEYFWFGYILILIFLGGMLILFSYISSLASNKTFNMMKILPMLIPTSLILLLIDDTQFFKKTNNKSSNKYYKLFMSAKLQTKYIITSMFTACTIYHYMYQKL